MSIEILNKIYEGNWRQHPDFTSYYFSEDGRCASIFKDKPRLIIGTLCGQYGYRAIPVYKHRRGQKIYVHRTICELFNGKPLPGQQCRHIDGNGQNNAASNLAWGSAKQNSGDMFIHGTAMTGEKNPMSKLTKSKVEEIRERASSGETQRSIAKFFNVSPMTVSRIVRKELWK